MAYAELKPLLERAIYPFYDPAHPRNINAKKYNDGRDVVEQILYHCERYRDKKCDASLLEYQINLYTFYVPVKMKELKTNSYDLSNRGKFKQLSTKDGNL